MKKIVLAVCALCLTAFFLTIPGCTANQRAKKFGGTAKVTLPAGQRLAMVTWKDDNLWCLTRAAKKDEAPITYTLKEDASFGVVEGTVVIIEQ